jgi:hypothetical protein
MTATLRVFRSVLALPLAAGRFFLTAIIDVPGDFSISPYGLV